MPNFQYKAKSVRGEVITGSIEAKDAAEARVKIRAQRMIPISVGTKTTGAKSGSSFSFMQPKVKPKELQVFTRQLSVLISAGVPIVPSMEALGKGARTPVLKMAINGITDDISTGKKMGEAFQSQGSVFDRFYINMVMAGEEGGVLDVVLSRLAVYIEKSVKLQAKIKGAMVYPIAVVVIAAAVVSGLLVFVVPKFAELFQNNGQELPALTQAVLNMSEFLQRYWLYMIGGLIVGIFVIKRYYQTPPGRAMIDDLLLRLPLFGDLQIKGGLAKFARTLSTLITAGVPILNAMEISKQVIGNQKLEAAVGRSKEAISQGKSMAAPLAQEKVVPHLVVQMIAVGEETGNLDTMLSKVADFFEDEVESVVASLTSLIEPILIVTLGGIIAFLVLAMYMPIFQMAGTQAGG